MLHANGARGPLTQHELIRMLFQEGLITTADHTRLLEQSRTASGSLHPLVALAQRALTDPSGKPLSLERLTEWMAGRFSLPYLKLDPLAIDFARIAEVMSSQYASRHGILPVALHDDHVV
ncbi:MAG: type II/IV secretion system protein, partial [Burkholderiales bacterium]